jgi:hypothetical protein
MRDRDPCSSLSHDGTAAVLVLARALLEDERGHTPYLRGLGRNVFAGRVRLAANEATEGLYRDRMFIAPLFRLLCDRGEAAGMTLATFKERLIDAHENGYLRLSTCRRANRCNPMMVAGSAIRYRRVTFHLIDRWPPQNLYVVLEAILLALSFRGNTNVSAYARRVREDERLRQGRKRLISLSPEAFAIRVQEVVNEEPGDMPVVELLQRLEERGEMTGFGLAAFKARLLAGHRNGRLTLGESDDGSEAVEASAISDHETTFTVVRRTDKPAPIPWGPPARIILPRRSPCFL